MERHVGRILPRLRAPGLRRTLLTFLAFAYLFVGFSHAISCTDEVLAGTFSSDIVNLPDDGPDDGGTKKSSVVAAHCYVCAPILMPAVVADAGPSDRPIKPSFVAPRLQFEDHPRLDTPPPKHLI